MSLTPQVELSSEDKTILTAMKQTMDVVFKPAKELPSSELEGTIKGYLQATGFFTRNKCEQASIIWVWADTLEDFPMWAIKKAFKNETNLITSDGNKSIKIGDVRDLCRMYCRGFPEFRNHVRKIWMK